MLSWHFAEHPWMRHYLIDFQSFVRVEIHHFLEKILELQGVDVITVDNTSMDLPEDLSLLCGKIVVDGVSVWICACEWQSLREHGKENDRRGEKVDICT